MEVNSKMKQIIVYKIRNATTFEEAKHEFDGFLEQYTQEIVKLMLTRKEYSDRMDKAFEQGYQQAMLDMDFDKDSFKAGYTEGYKDAEAIAVWGEKLDASAERICRMKPSDYYPCAEDGCTRLKERMWICSECEADYVGNKPNYCPTCGCKVVSE